MGTISSKDVVDLMIDMFGKSVSSAPLTNNSSTDSKVIPKKDKSIVILEVPGFAKEDISIEVSRPIDCLIMNVTGTVSLKNSSGEVWYTKSIHEKVRVSNDADLENISATVVNGLLRIEIPRKASDPKEVKIKVL